LRGGEWGVGIRLFQCGGKNALSAIISSPSPHAVKDMVTLPLCLVDDGAKRLYPCSRIFVRKSLGGYVQKIDLRRDRFGRELKNTEFLLGKPCDHRQQLFDKVFNLSPEDRDASYGGVFFVGNRRNIAGKELQRIIGHG